MGKLKEWAIRKKQWLKGAIGRAIRRMAQSAACGLLLSLDLTGEVSVRGIFNIAWITGVACLLASIAQYRKYEKEGTE